MNFKYNKNRFQMAPKPAEFSRELRDKTTKCHTVVRYG